ncbi:class I lanthipeptide [Kordia jejudonensis]|uniref:class I lanthipeptide n=1 Tax=Kordia jejudonensis TaxID=1348245 RepID=UPI000629BF2D|nr:class I lanthipeptide [Kordia jejudonensis]
MKKNKKSVQKLTLNKKVVSNLEREQISGGTILTAACPNTIFCPTRFCPTKFNCPTLYNCPTFVTCPTLGGCPSLAGGCPTTF